MSFWSKAVNILYQYTDKQIATSKLGHSLATFYTGGTFI